MNIILLGAGRVGESVTERLASEKHDITFVDTSPEKLADLRGRLHVVTADTAVMACVNHIGPGLGAIGPAGNFGVLDDFQTWVCTFGMLLGRLDLLGPLVRFTPQDWRR